LAGVEVALDIAGLFAPAARRGMGALLALGQRRKRPVRLGSMKYQAFGQPPIVRPSGKMRVEPCIEIGFEGGGRTDRSIAATLAQQREHSRLASGGHPLVEAIA
jgi:hypothetical protein